MVNEILTAAGFVEGETYKETRFLKPPRTTYAVFFDTVESRGADNVNLIQDHSVSIELYEYYPDSGSESNIENELKRRGIPYTKEPRFWLDTEQLYQVVYDFNYTAKEHKSNG